MKKKTMKSKIREQKKSQTWQRLDLLVIVKAKLGLFDIGKLVKMTMNKKNQTNDYSKKCGQDMLYSIIEWMDLEETHVWFGGKDHLIPQVFEI